MFFDCIWSFSCSMGRKKMKNYLILFGLLFSVFIIPSDVLAAGEDLYIPYYNKVEDFDVESGEGETLKNILYESSFVEKVEGDRCLLLFDNDKYYLICTTYSMSSIVYFYGSRDNMFMCIFNSPLFRIYQFDESYIFLKDYNSFTLTTSHNSFENKVLYSDINFSFNANGINNIYFYDINDSSKIYGQFNISDLYTYKDFYLTEFKEDIVVFQDNDIHNISKLILGDNIPEEYSFVYTISDYLIVLIFVGIIISPIAIIIKVLRW